MTHRSPVFLLGAPRSGTSLLYRLLCLHPEVTFLNQYVRRAPALTGFAAFNKLPRAYHGLRDRAWFAENGNAYVYGRPRALGQRLVPQPVEGEPFFAGRGMGPAMSATEARGWDPVGLRRAVGRFAAFDGGRVFVSKRINHNRRIEALHKAFPAARFVHLVRDGRAVALSLTRVDWWSECDLWWRGGLESSTGTNSEDNWSLAARHWNYEVAAVDQGLDAVDERQVLVASYEQLVASPTEVMDEVRRFSGLGEDEQWIDRIVDHPFPPAGDRWRDVLTRQQVETAERVQSAALVLHGYSMVHEDRGG